MGPLKSVACPADQLALRAKYFLWYHINNEQETENSKITDIKKYRNKLGLTQDDLVRKSGVKHTTLTKIEGDFVQKPSVQVIAKIAKALGVSIKDLLK